MCYSRFFFGLLLWFGLCAQGEFLYLCGDRPVDGVPASSVHMNGQWADGVFGRVVRVGYDHSASVTVEDHAAVRVGKDSFTLSMWLCPERLSVSGKGAYRRLLAHVGKQSFWVLDVFPDGRLMFSMKDRLGHYASTKSEAVLRCGVWQHVVVRVDRQAFTTSYWVDGVWRGVRSHSRRLTESLDAPGVPLLISTWPGRMYQGLFGEFRLRQGCVSDTVLREEYASGRRRFSSVSHTLKEVERLRIKVELPPPGWVQDVWDLKRLSRPPRTFAVMTEPFASLSGDAVKPLMYEGEPYEGKPTRVFAWLGFPAGASAEKPVPGVVLVHGGGGTAFRSWVKTWNDRGYAAIAMDTCGHLPLPLDRDSKPWPGHAWSGPAGWGGFARVDAPIRDQWTYHAVSAVILGHSLLRSQDRVDPTRIGVTGISWGGYLTNIVAGVDSRFAFAAPIYGCGFLGDGTLWEGRLRNMGLVRGSRWLQLWDPARYVGGARMPMLFCNGTNDIFYLPTGWHRTTLLPQGPVSRSYKIRMPHGHGKPGDPPEVRAFADAICRGGEPLVSLGQLERTGRKMCLKVTGGARLVRDVKVAYTVDRGDWPKRKWVTDAASWEASRALVTVTVPPDATAAYLMVEDSRGLLVTSPLSFYDEE